MTNGMKPGSGDDPFADDEDDVDDESGSDPFDESDEPVKPTSQTDSERPSPSDPMPRVPEHPGDVDSRLPWIHRRDGVKDDRAPKTIHYTDHTLEREDELQDALETALGEDVSMTDAREAAYLVGLDRIDDVADVLREWGYDVE